ncbi:acyl-CoA desaturase [Polyangium sp. 15x6]|nr:acyl-CoA desaturase [Polyangium sp. 15x6]MDI3291850.1 acyl-CoA desaturase [Polyangium sp. 15x6]
MTVRASGLAYHGGMAIALFFVGHWALSIFCQTFFLHRYASHRMFTMSKGWERFFYLLTFIAQGSSFLVPRAYAILHRHHHAYSDTERDPHSPRHTGNPFAMMWGTKKRYHDLAYRIETPEPKFDGGYPEWELVDRIGGDWPGRLAWGTAYVVFYLVFATAWWQFLLLPAHFLMGVIHGAIVNWCGHRYGYRNFDSKDDSRNTLPFDFVTMGELFQNNHHRFGQAPNFAVRAWELDPTWHVIRLLAFLKIIDLGEHPQVGRYEPSPEVSPIIDTAT